MNEREFMDDLEKRLSEKGARKVKARVLVQFLDMADEALNQQDSPCQSFHSVRLWSPLTRTKTADWLSREWRWASQATRVQALHLWQAVLYILRWLQVDPVETTCRSRKYTTEQKSICLEMHKGFQRLVRQIWPFEVLIVILATASTGLFEIRRGMQAIPFASIHVHWLMLASVLLSGLAAFLASMTVVAAWPHIVRLIKVFWIVRPDWNWQPHGLGDGTG